MSTMKTTINEFNEYSEKKIKTEEEILAWLTDLEKRVDENSIEIDRILAGLTRDFPMDDDDEII